MSQHRQPDRLLCPAFTRVAAGGAALKDASRRRWPRGRARPSLTAAPPAALGQSGRDEKTALQPNQKTGIAGAGRTTHALQKADIFMRHEHGTDIGTDKPSNRSRSRFWAARLTNHLARKAPGYLRLAV
jgi:hypothetical protein